jgi:hypothetical protein
MLENLFQLYKIGKELGLSKKEINRVFLFDDSRYPLFYKILMIIVFIFLGIFVIILGIEASRHIYPAGTLYSTVRIKDFRAKNDSIKFK